MYIAALEAHQIKKMKIQTNTTNVFVYYEMNIMLQLLSQLFPFPELIIC